MSIELATQHEDHYVAGYGWRALGVAYATHDPVQAQAAFTQAITLFQTMKLPNEVEKTACTAQSVQTAF